MKSYRGVGLALGLSVGCVLVAAGCALRARALGQEADWLLLRGTAQASEYVASFDGRHVDQELVSFQARRAVLERAHAWQGVATALLIATCVALVAAYGAFLFGRLGEQELPGDSFAQGGSSAVDSHPMPGCGHCGHKLDVVGNQVGRRDTCPACGAELRACVSCRHYDPHVAKECKEPLAEVPSDKESANFCELFQIGEGGETRQREHDDQLAAAEALFRKK